MSTLTPMRTRRLLVSRQDPVTRCYHPLGELSQNDDGFTFVYRAGVTRPLPGMSDVTRAYESATLFPLFRHRVISPRRDDHADYLAGLELPPDAPPFEVLARSGGRSAVDTLEITPIPEPGDVDLLFLVHGIRHLDASERERIEHLTPGRRLRLQAEPTNRVDPLAMLVTHDGVRLGYVPGPLLDGVRAIAEGPHELTVARVNPPEVGYHMRLLVRLTGALP